MAKTSEAAAHNGVCPVCGGPLTRDLAGKGFVRHGEAPDRATRARLLADPALTPEAKAFLRETGLCPWGQGQRDGEAA